MPRVYGGCKTLATFDEGLAPSSEIHIATDGSNVTGDGSAGNPFATIAHAVNLAQPGTAIVIHSGVYPGGTFINNLHGTAQAPIWIGGAPGEARPIIHGGSEGLHFIQARYVIVDDLEVRNSANNGINADDGGEYDNMLASHHLIFRNLYIHDIGGGGNQDGLKLSGINDFAVVDCEITRCGGASSGSAIDMVGCHHGVIANCQMYDLSANAVQIKGGSFDITVQWCRITNAGQRGINIGGSTGFEFFRPPLSTTSLNAEARDVRVASNIFEGTLCAFAFVGCENSVVSNNTIVNPTNWLFRILQETTTGGGYTFVECRNNTVRNNLWYFDRSDLSTYVNIGANTEPATFQFTNNLWYAHDNPASSTPTLPAPEANGIYGQNPLLSNPAGGNYHIPAESPAANAGAAPVLVARDFDRICYQNPPSIGAFEIPRLGDLNGDGSINVSDLFQLLAAWGDCDQPCPPVCPADLNDDCDVNVNDLFTLLANWG